MRAAKRTVKAVRAQRARRTGRDTAAAARTERRGAPGRLKRRRRYNFAYKAPACIRPVEKLAVHADISKPGQTGGPNLRHRGRIDKRYKLLVRIQRAKLVRGRFQHCAHNGVIIVNNCIIGYIAIRKITYIISKQNDNHAARPLRDTRF